MYKLSYNYYPNTNRLNYVADAVSSANYSTDIDNQNKDNYAYDSIGNLVRDNQAGINNITWNVYGKILSIAGKNVNYQYDATGNRIYKYSSGITEYYVRDAQGNVMATYSNKEGKFGKGEQHLYGSSRLGIVDKPKNLDLVTGIYLFKLGTGYRIEFERGKKQFELTNHLGNVLATISDKKIPVSADNRTIDYYLADVVTATDYAPFGMDLVGRTYKSSSYKYGFNGKEYDKETNTQDYGFRIYNPSIGRFLSVDPLFKSFPWYTPYQFSGNSPILHIDLDGLEEVNSIIYMYDKMVNNRQLKKTEWLDIDRYTASRTFADAAAYNTMQKNSHLYQPINQIHNYYQWADEKLKASNIDIRWFKATEEVTAPFFGIGASQHPLGRLGGGFSKDASAFLASGNAFLFDKNIGMMKDILKNKNFQGLTGKVADYAMVISEQTALTGFMKDYEGKVGSKKFNSVMDNLNKSLNDPTLGIEIDYIKKAKETIGGDIDFRKQEHREILGKSLVDKIRNEEKK